MKINANGMDFKALNDKIRQAKERKITIEDVTGQRYIGCGLADTEIKVLGVPGNALGAYLDGAKLIVMGNAQDATGDTMNDGEIIIHGTSGDGTGYAMRGGRILVKGNAGYRTGIHMKAYKEKLPVIVIGGNAGSFLGEYQAGGYLVVLGLEESEKPPVGPFCGTGMHGGKIFIRSNVKPDELPKQVEANQATPKQLEEILPSLKAFCDAFDRDLDEVLNCDFYILTPNSKNPYKQLYTHN